MGDDDHRLVKAQLRTLLAAQVAHHALGDVLDVDEPLAQVGIVDPAQRFHVAAHQLVVNEIDVQPFVAHGLANVIEDGDVLQKHQMGLENIPFSALAAFFNAGLQGEDFLLGRSNRVVQAG